MREFWKKYKKDLILDAISIITFILFVVFLFAGIHEFLKNGNGLNTKLAISGISLCITLLIMFRGMDEIKEEFEPWDVVIYKPTNERGLVKKVTDAGVFVVFRIQSTAQLCKPEDLEKE